MSDIAALFRSLAPDKYADPPAGTLAGRVFQGQCKIVRDGVREGYTLKGLAEALCVPCADLREAWLFVRRERKRETV